MEGDIPAKKGRLGRRLALGIVVAVLSVGAVATSGFGQSGDDPITAHRFVLTIDGYEIASFGELIGITLEVEPTSYWDTSGDTVKLSKLPGKLTPPTVVLKRGLTGSLELWSWHEAVRAGSVATARKSVSLTAFNAEGRPVARWWLENAWPSKLEAGALSSENLEPMMETVTLTAEFIQRVAV